MFILEAFIHLLPGLPLMNLQGGRSFSHAGEAQPFLLEESAAAWRGGVELAEASEAGGRARWRARALGVLTASGWPLAQMAGRGLRPFCPSPRPLCLSLRVWS